jgi:hypothetical protein
MKFYFQVRLIVCFNYSSLWHYTTLVSLSLLIPEFHNHTLWHTTVGRTPLDE